MKLERIKVESTDQRSMGKNIWDPVWGMRGRLYKRMLCTKHRQS